MFAHIALRPTLAGWAAWLAVALLLPVGWVAHDNVLVWLASLAVGLLLVDAWLGSRQLASLVVRRQLPSVAFAQQDVRGALQVVASRVATGVWVADQHGASARISRLEPGQSVSARVAWRFEDRGCARWTALRLTSRWPFGLWRHTRVVHAEQAMWIAPTPGAVMAVDDAPRGPSAAAASAADSGGDLFDGLRAWRVGEPVRLVHWRTSVRARRWIAVKRAHEPADAIVVRVADVAGPAWERALSDAVATLLDAQVSGRPFALALPGGDRRWQRPARGRPWLDRLLCVLAQAERR